MALAHFGWMTLKNHRFKDSRENRDARLDMNELQEQIFDVIVSLLSGKSFASSVNNSAVRYGFLNYIAKFSLANDYYYSTPSACIHLSNKGLISSKGLRRGVKSRRQGFSYEHVIPVNLIGKEILKNQSSSEMVHEILMKTSLVVILTAIENSRLVGSLRSNMPEEFDFKTSDPFIRYDQVGLPGRCKLNKVAVYGSLRR